MHLNLTEVETQQEVTWPAVTYKVFYHGRVSRISVTTTLLPHPTDTWSETRKEHKMSSQGRHRLAMLPRNSARMQRRQLLLVMPWRSPVTIDDDKFGIQFDQVRWKYTESNIWPKANYCSNIWYNSIEFSLVVNICLLFGTFLIKYLTPCTRCRSGRSRC